MNPVNLSSKLINVISQLKGIPMTSWCVKEIVKTIDPPTVCKQGSGKYTVKQKK